MTRRTGRQVVVQNAPYAGLWGNEEEGGRGGRPQGWAALDWLGQALEQSQPDGKVTRVSVAAIDLQALGRSLRRIAGGEDARHVFAQSKVGHRQDDNPTNQAIAMIYWATLAQLLHDGTMSEPAAKREAIARAQRRYPRKTLDAATVTRYARKWRDKLMPLLNHMESTGQGPNLSALRKHLAKHSAHMGDGPDLPPLSTTRKPRR